jgi:hypothetical protein
MHAIRDLNQTGELSIINVKALVLRLAAILPSITILSLGALSQGPLQKRTWTDMPSIAMLGGLKVFWNVEDSTDGQNHLEALAHGFRSLTILGTYADYPGNQKEHIGYFLGSKSRNPWNKPPYFERIIRRNIAESGTSGTYVHDIEIDFEQDTTKAWADTAARAASRAPDYATFDEAYFREWASWFWLPAQWTKDMYPWTKVGLYGPQPFRRDYWGIAGRDATQIDGAHQNDWRLWQYIDPHVDFYVASIYVFYAVPDSVFYMAANVEENYQRTRALGDKPVYAYEWLRYHSGNWREGNRELDPYLVEAMAIIPYFTGAKGIVLWGYEPQLKPSSDRPYSTLPLFMETLARVAGLSEKIGRGELVIDEPASVLWNAKRPFVRRVVVSPTECVVGAINPWQGDNATSKVIVPCGARRHEIELKGRHTALVDIEGEKAIRH